MIRLRFHFCPRRYFKLKQAAYIFVRLIPHNIEFNAPCHNGATSAVMTFIRLFKAENKFKRWLYDSIQRLNLLKWKRILLRPQMEAKCRERGKDNESWYANIKRQMIWEISQKWRRYNFSLPSEYSTRVKEIQLSWQHYYYNHHYIMLKDFSLWFHAPLSQHVNVFFFCAYNSSSRAKESFIIFCVA